MHHSETDTRKKQEPAESIGGYDLELYASVPQHQDNYPAIKEHRDNAEEITNQEQHDEKSDARHHQNRSRLPDCGSGRPVPVDGRHLGGPPCAAVDHHRIECARRVGHRPPVQLRHSGRLALPGILLQAGQVNGPGPLGCGEPDKEVQAQRPADLLAQETPRPAPVGTPDQLTNQRCTGASSSSWPRSTSISAHIAANGLETE